MKKIVYFLLFFLFLHSAAFASETLFNRMLALAQKGEAEAQYHVGMMYNNGLGTQKSPREALKWFQKSAASGFALAHYKVGCYYDGQGAGIVEQNMEKALGHKLKAAQAGYALAQSDVAGLYWEKKNFSESFKWIKAAADQGNAKSLYNVSMFYKDGMGVEKDPVRAYAYFKLAQLSARGTVNANAQNALDSIAKEMKAGEREQAEELVTEWKPQPTLLTQQAMDGIGRAEEYLRQVK